MSIDHSSYGSSTEAMVSDGWFMASACWAMASSPIGPSPSMPWDPPRDRTPWWWWSTWCPMVPTNQHVAWILKKHHKFKRVRCIYQKYTDIFVKLLCKALLVGGFNLLWKMMEFVSWDDEIPNWMESHKLDIPNHRLDISPLTINPI